MPLRMDTPRFGKHDSGSSGEMRTPITVPFAAVIENKRSIFAGGAYTIGAWKSIFDNVADDLVQELKNRINGEGFVVSLTPYSEQSSGTVRTTNPCDKRSLSFLAR